MNFDKDFLQENPTFFSRLGFCYDPPLLDENGEPVVFSKNFQKTAKYHKDMLDAGVRLHTCIVHAGWVGYKNGVNQYDYSLTDKTLDSLAGIGEEAYILPRIKLNVPIDWCMENPEDVFVYYEGPRTVEGIQSLVGTLRQDYLGYESPKGYYQAQEYEDKRPNVNSLIARQSISSKKWLEDAGKALEDFIAHLKTKSYYDRIVGIHVCFGPSGESMHWGRDSNHYGDYGIRNLQNFYDFGLKKYNDRETLAEKWCQADVAPNCVEVPSPEVRYSSFDNIQTFFRGDKQDIICRDFDEFLSKSVTDAIDYFGGIVKRETHKKLVGVFYGYFVYMFNSSYGGHLDMDGVFNSKNVDFLAAPKPYYRMLSGEPSGDMTAAASVNLNKIWMEELDFRTNLIQDANEQGWATSTFQQTFYVFWRNVCKNLSQGSGFWWMDLGGGWFDSPIIHKEISRTNDFLSKVGTKGASVADVLIVVDEKSMYGMRLSNSIGRAFMEDFICETRCSGVLCDVYRLSDINKIDLSRYKLVIFAFTFDLSKQMLETLPFREDATFMFNYCAGVRGDGTVSLQNTEKLTGFQLEEYAMQEKAAARRSVVGTEDYVMGCASKSYDFPTLSIAGTQDKTVRKNVAGRMHVMNVQPYLSAKTIAEIASQAGCHMYSQGRILYGNDRFLGVFAIDESDAKVCFNKEKTGYAYFSGKRFKGKEVDLHLKKDEYEIFIFEE